MSKDTESQARNKLTKQVLIGMSLGVLLGVFLNYLNGLGELFAQWMQLQTVLSNGVFPADLFQTADQVVAEQKRLAGAYHTLFQQSFVQSAMEYLMGFYSWMVDGFFAGDRQDFCCQFEDAGCAIGFCLSCLWCD